MASAESTRTAAGPGEPAPDRNAMTPAAVPLGVTIALSSLLAIGTFTLIAPILRGIVPVTTLPDPLPDHHQDAETLLFVLAFAVLLPFGVWSGARISDRIATGPNADSASALTALLTGLLTLVLIGARLSSEVVLSAGSAVWLAVAALALARAAAPRDWAAGARLAPHAAVLWIAVAVLLGGAALAFTTIDSISWPLLIAGGLAIAAFVAALGRVTLPRAGRRLGTAADAAVVVLLLLAIPNLEIFAAGGGTADAVQDTIIQFHQNFFLGPANQVLAGDAMLVDTLSQYGVGSIYFLAGLFTVIPIGNENLGLIEGVLSALMFAGAWAVMRIAGVSRLLAAFAMLVAVVALVYGLQYPLGGLLQHGAIRFGLPIGVVVGAVSESRWPRAALPGRLLQLLTVGIASIWALEAFAYTVLVALAIVSVALWLAPAGARRREFLRRISQLVVACLLAHFLLAATTLLVTGQLPDWGWYLNTLRQFLVGGIGDLTYDFSPWSPGLALGALYMVSCVAVVLFAIYRRDVLVRERTAFVAVAGFTALGVGLFTYLVNRSTDHIVPYVSLPAVVLGALWLSLLQRPSIRVPLKGRAAAWAVALGLSVLLLSVAESSTSSRFADSPLGYLRPGGPSPSFALEQLKDPPPIQPGAEDGERLLETYLPDESRTVVIAKADLATEVLLATGRGSAIPLADPWEDSLVPDAFLGRLDEFVRALRPGDEILIGPPVRDLVDAYRADPDRDPLAEPVGDLNGVPSGIAPLQEWTIKEVGKRYDFERLAISPSGLEIVRLVPRDSDPSDAPEPPNR